MATPKNLHLSEIDKDTVLESLKDKYTVVRKIGYGSFGSVFEAIPEKSQGEESVAIKVIQNKSSEPEIYESYKNEVSILFQFKNPNIVRIFDSWEEELNGFLVMEFCNDGDLAGYLKTHLQESGPLPEGKALQMMHQILNGMKDLHKKNIVHRDLKPDNIFLKDKQLKLADMGVSKQISDAKQIMETCRGTPLYMAPEILYCEDYDQECDLYSLGCLLYEMVYGKCPFDAKSMPQLFKLLDKPVNYELDGVHISEKLQNLLSQMLKKDRKERIKFDQLYQHELFIASPFQDKYIQNLHDSQGEDLSMFERSKQSIISLKEDLFKRKSTSNITVDSLKKGFFGMGSKIKDKINSTMEKNKGLQNIFDIYHETKDREKAIIDITLKYLDIMNTQNLLGQVFESIQDNLQTKNYYENEQQRIQAQGTQFLLLKKLFFLHSNLENNMKDKTYQLNQTKYQEKLFNHRLFKNLVKMVVHTKNNVKEKIDNFLKNESISLQNFKIFDANNNNNFSDEVSNPYKYSQNSSEYFYKKSLVEMVQIKNSKLQQINIDFFQKKYIKNQQELFLMLSVLEYDSIFAQNQDNGFEQFRSKNNKISIEERQDLINKLIIKSKQY